MPRLIALILFGLMFLVETTQAYGLFWVLFNPTPVAERLEISLAAEVLRAAILLILALAVAIGALLAVVGMLGRRRELFLAGAMACAIGYLVYGLFQLASGMLHLGSGGVVLSGVIYLALGAIAYAMRRSVAEG